MNILVGIQRLSKSIAEETDPEIITSTKAVIAGMGNFYFGKKYDYALDKYENFCLNCPSNVEDPVESMHVEDKQIPGLSGRMCSDCGCTLSFKTRQNIKPCSKWKSNSK